MQRKDRVGNVSLAHHTALSFALAFLTFDLVFRLHFQSLNPV
jgi:hypothetical protein